MDDLSIQILAAYEEAKGKGEKLIKASDDAWARKIAIAKSAAVDQPPREAGTAHCLKLLPELA